MGIASIIIDIAVRAGNAAGEIDQTASSMDKFKSGLGAMAGPAAAAVGAIGGVAAVAVKFASEAQQATGAVDAVFKDNAAVINEWAKTSADATGLSAAAYQNAAAGIGGALTGMGVATDTAAESSAGLIQRGADLASVYGGTALDATNAMTSAFRGEYDGLQRLIPSINAAKIEQEMAAQAAAGQTFASEEQAKASAITSVIMNESADAAGNFAKESDTLAGQQARASAAFEDTAAKLGEQLLPAVTTVMEWLSKLGAWVSDHIPLVTTLAVVIGGFAAAILAANVVLGIMSTVSAVAATTIGGYTIAQIAATAATWAFNAAMAVLTSPITIIIAAIAAVVAVIVLLIKNWDTVSAGAIKAFNAIKTAVTTAIDWVIKKVKEAIKWFGELLSSIPVIGGLFGGSQSTQSVGVRYWTAATPSLAQSGLLSTSTRVAGRSSAGGVTVNVSGALDPVAVARQIDRLLTQQRRRSGGIAI